MDVAGRGASFAGMAVTEIIAELPKLSAQEREDVLACLLELEEQDIAAGAGPDPAEAKLLDEALREHEANPGAAKPWAEVQERLRQAR